MADSLFSSGLIGTAMPVELTWVDLVIRLVCTLIAGAIIGYDRGERSKAAGLRTTVLVCMAASVAMLQMNYLLPLAGRPTDSFVTNDLMRLPLGILTGVGFIGGGVAALSLASPLRPRFGTSRLSASVLVAARCSLAGWQLRSVFVLSGLRWF